MRFFPVKVQPPRAIGVIIRDRPAAPADPPAAMIRTLRLIRFAMLLILAVSAGSATAATRDLVILGWVERVQLVDPGLTLKAKLDSGAETSSLDARIIKKFRKDGKRWVRFALTDPGTGEEHVLVRERIRTIGVVQHEGGNQVRPTVMMQACIADRLLDIEVSLVDRSEFSYRLLLGRRALRSFALIDTGNTYLTRPQCKMPKANVEAGS
jgi:hypothetical protein